MVLLSLLKMKEEEYIDYSYEAATGQAARAHDEPVATLRSMG